jgi:beta-galactosidase
VENNGRINYGPYLTDNRQGITEKVTFDNSELNHWQMYRFPFSNTAGFIFGANKVRNDEPALYSGTFYLHKTGDTFLDLHGYGKGFVFLNGHNLGKYWFIGPQQTLYIPACWLNKGANHIVVFDELKSDHRAIKSLDHPILNEVAKD